MHKRFLIAGALFGGLAVVFGAFGAHGLESLTKDAGILHAFQTGVKYQMYHALALLALGILGEKNNSGWLKWAGNLFITGILLFSGSLYLITLLKLQVSNLVKFAGPVTPAGGLCLVAGWLFLFMAVFKKK